MSIGIAVTKVEIDSRVGDTARSFLRAFEQVDDIKFFLDATPDDDLVALGYTANEVAVIKTAFGDLTQLRQIWEGTATLGTAKDFRTFVRRLWGVGP